MTVILAIVGCCAALSWAAAEDPSCTCRLPVLPVAEMGDNDRLINDGRLWASVILLGLLLALPLSARIADPMLTACLASMASTEAIRMAALRRFRRMGSTP